MSENQTTTDGLVRQQTRRENALNNISRQKLETATLPTGPIRGCKILACPFIFGVNLDSGAKGFSDFRSSRTVKRKGCDSDDEEEDEYEEEDRNAPIVATETYGMLDLALTKISEIFYGVLFQKAIGTPSLLDPDVISPTRLSDELYAKQLSYDVFMNHPSTLKNGMYNIAFADYWKRRFNPEVTLVVGPGSSTSTKDIPNYLDLQFMHGVPRWEQSLKGMRDALKKQRTGGNSSGGGLPTLDPPILEYRDEDDDVVSEEGVINNDPYSCISNTSRSALLESAQAGADEKITIILYRIRRAVASSVAQQRYRNTSTTTNTGPVSALLDEPLSFGIGDTLQQHQPQHDELSENANLLDDESGDEDVNLESVDDDDDDTGFLSTPTPPPTLPQHQQYLDYDSNIGGVDDNETIGQRFLPFKNHKGALGAGEIEYYDALYLPDLPKEALTSEEFAGYDWIQDTSNSDYVGFIALAIVKDPNWNSKVAMYGLCNNKSKPSKGGRSTRKRGGGGGGHHQSSRDSAVDDFNPFFTFWHNPTNPDHASNKFCATDWNSWSEMYLSKCETDPQPRNRHTTTTTTTTSPYVVAAEDLHHGAAFDGLNSVEDPDAVYSLENALRWMKHFGGDVRDLSASATYSNEQQLWSCLFRGADCYRIPYRAWDWGTKDFLGLGQCYFPWEEDPSIAFLKYEVLGMQRPRVDRTGQSLVVVKEEGLAGSGGGGGGGGGTTVKQLLVATTSPEFAKVLGVMNHLRKDAATSRMAQANNVHLGRLDIPARATVKRILREQKRKPIYATQLKFDDLEMAFTTCLELQRPEGYSPVSLNNGILMLQEQFSPIWECVYREKPKESTLGCEVGTQGGASVDWFLDPKKGNDCKRTLSSKASFVQQYRRYCRLKEKCEDMVCDQLEDALNSDHVNLTKAVRALNMHHRRFLAGVSDFNLDFVRHDLESSSLGNYLDKMALHVRHIMQIPKATHHFMLLALGLMDCYRYEHNLHFNCYNSGPGATSKSHVCDALLAMLVLGTVIVSDDATHRALNIETEDLSDMILYMDEVTKRIMGQGGGGGNKNQGGGSDPSATMFKKLLSTMQLVLSEFRWIDMPDGSRMRARRDLVTNIICSFLGNGNDTSFDEATLTRFYRSMFSKVGVEFTADQGMDKDACENNIKTFLSAMEDKMVQGQLPTFGDKFDPMSQPVAADAANGGGIEEAFDEAKETEDLRKRVEEFISKLKSRGSGPKKDPLNHMLSRGGDAIITRNLPKTTVTQAMFQEALASEQSAPFSTEDKKQGIADRLKMHQVFTNYAFKLMQLKILPNPNLTLAHMTCQVYYSYLSSNGNIEFKNYRCYLRVMILCAVLSIFDAMVHLFAVEGCDITAYNPNDPFVLSWLKAAKPYMWATQEHAIFAATLLSDECIGPYDSIIMDLFIHNCCSYMKKEDILKTANTFKGLKQDIKRLEAYSGLTTDDDLVAALHHLQEESQHNASSLAYDQIIVTILESRPTITPTVIATAPTPTATGPRTLRPADEDDEPDEPDVVDPVSTDSTSNTNDDDGGQPATTTSVVNQTELIPIIKRILKGLLLPHELYLITHDGGGPTTIAWHTKSDPRNHYQSGRRHDGDGGGGNSGQAPNLAPVFNKTNKTSTSSGTTAAASTEVYGGGYTSSSSTSSNNDKLFDLNYVKIEARPWNVATKIRGAMINFGPSPQDVRDIIMALTTRTITAPWAYTKAFSPTEIRGMVGKSWEDLEKEGLAVKNSQLKLCFISPPETGEVEGISMCVHVMDNLKNPMDLITEAVKSLIYRGMKPGRYQLGLMSDSRGNFAYIDITQEMIDASDKDYFGVVTGAFMTERERNVVFYRQDVPKEPTTGKQQQPKKNTIPRGYHNHQGRKVGSRNEELPVESPDQNMFNMELYDIDPACSNAQDWIETLAKQSDYRFSGDSAYRSNSIRIRGCVNEWMCVRHFLNAGIPFGPHPMDQTRLCWYSRPLFLTKSGKAVCRQRKDYIEYRDFPTPFNVRMRAIYHLVVLTPALFEEHKKYFFMNPVWVDKALRHFSWLDPTLITKYGLLLQPTTTTTTATVTTRPHGQNSTIPATREAAVTRVSLPSDNVTTVLATADPARRSQYNSAAVGMQSQESESSQQQQQLLQQKKRQLDSSRQSAGRTSKRQKRTVTIM